MTLHAAKGLEFPIVIVAGLDSGSWPVPEDFDDAGLFAERVESPVVFAIAKEVLCSNLCFAAVAIRISGS
jgi:superfamily I DNA/RNA helicase